MTDSPPSDVRILKAPNTLKTKVGNGGINDKAITMAEGRLSNSAEMFPSVADEDLRSIENVLIKIESGDTSAELLKQVYSSCVELKSHSAMFKFPLVTSMTDSLMGFLDKIDGVSDIVREVIAVHLRTLKIAIAKGPKAISEKDHAELLQGLKKACEKALSTT